MSLKNYLQAAQEAALRAADVLEFWRKKFQIREKARFDLVTDADVASQKTIREYLLGRFTDHAFLGEEETTRAKPGPDAPPTWIVDPIDGTTNYVHDLPLYGISIGLQVARELVAGVVYEPTRKEMFAAAKGHGATLNGEPLRTSTTDSPAHALIATGFPYDMRDKEFLIDWWRYFGLHARSLRRTGSTAINMAYLAAGRFDAFYAFDNHVWDVAGGTVIVREAGGMVTNVAGAEFDPYRPDILASNGPLQTPLIEIFRKGPREIG